MRICSRCGLLNERRTAGRYCLPCAAEYHREWRKTHPLSAEAAFKDRARSYANVYVRRGKLKREACRKCGGVAQMHHEDYSKPLEVDWLCRPCHMALHLAAP